MIDSTTRAELRADLSRDEGRIPTPYKCPAGKWTIGVGRNFEDRSFSIDELQYLSQKRDIYGPLSHQVKVLNKQPLVAAEITLLLNNDIDNSIKDANGIFGPSWLKWKSERQRAVLNMLFNLGKTRFLSFRRSISMMRAGDWGRAADNILLSKWASQVGLRAERISKLMR